MQEPLRHSPLSRPHEVSLYRRAIADAMAQECGESVLKALNELPRIQYLYGQDARVFEGYTIREHSEMVVRQYMLFFAKHELPAGMSRGEFLLTLGLHDVGKPVPVDKRDQHRATIDLMCLIRDQLPFSERGYTLAQFLIGNDLLGKYIQSTLITRSSLGNRARLIDLTRQGQLSKSDVDEIVDEVTFVPMQNLHQTEEFTTAALSVSREISSVANELGLPASQLFELLIIYYQCDTSAYTASARTFSGKCACPGLDFLYERNDPRDPSTYLSFCDEKRRLKFVPYVEGLLDRVKSSLPSFAPVEVPEA